ncbi:unnamed protein product [Lepeophtheirus salmonis]|uniref:(salmon louse) hypothetical protein n=1 Tax=Lepeophtheirus salmonis TaxID=72036 RepID=A0A7R8HDP9_LEPSM|nr:unnamed protein product [Lepeophtheirus salmonis]CAF3034461.1 unnamed protein product [Lepeophtheirus salmonis]
MSCSSEESFDDESTSPSSLSPPPPSSCSSEHLIEDEVEDEQDVVVEKRNQTLKKQIQLIEKQVQKSLRESSINPATRAKFISICSKFERTSPTRSALPDGSVMSRAKLFAESSEDREQRLRDTQERRDRFKVTKSSFELLDDFESPSSGIESGNSTVLRSIFHRKDSEKRMAEEMERLQLEEEAKMQQKKAFAEKVSMFGRVA